MNPGRNPNSLISTVFPGDKGSVVLSCTEILAFMWQVI